MMENARFVLDAQTPRIQTNAPGNARQARIRHLDPGSGQRIEAVEVVPQRRQPLRHQQRMQAHLPGRHLGRQLQPAGALTAAQGGQVGYLAIQAERPGTASIEANPHHQASGPIRPGEPLFDQDPAQLRRAHHHVVRPLETRPLHTQRLQRADDPNAHPDRVGRRHALAGGNWPCWIR